MVHVLVAVLVFAAAGVPTQEEWKEIAGTIRQIDHQKKAISIETGQDREFLLQVEPSTTILIDGQLSALDELPRGADVRASFREGKQLRRAQWIEVQRAQGRRNAPQDPRQLVNEPNAPTPKPPVKHR